MGIIDDLTKHKFEQFKNSYNVYHFTTELDRYNNETRVYDQNPSFTITVMFTPVTNEAAVLEYGEHITSMKQCVYYGSEKLQEFDHILIGSVMYTVKSIKDFNTHKLVLVDKDG